MDRHTDVARRYMLQATMEEFGKAVLRELDFRQEARNLVLLAENLRDYGKIVVPLPIDALTTSKVFTMEYTARTQGAHTTNPGTPA